MSRSNWPAGKILIIDDNEDDLNGLYEAVERAVSPIGGKVDKWRPAHTDDVLVEMEKRISEDMTLVITDYELTKNGPPGFLGTSVVSWCQDRLVPVGDYSRGTHRRHSEEPNTYEFHLPTTYTDAASVIAGIYSGFREISTLMNEDHRIAESGSLAMMLALMLNRPEMVSRLSLYSPQISANSSLKSRLVHHRADMKKMSTYIIGHMLFNSILKYPGPIMDIETLCAYVAVGFDNKEFILDVFRRSHYRGPFSSLGQYFWRDDVDAIFEQLAATSKVEFVDNAGTNRRLLLKENFPSRELSLYNCERCGGERGGFRCPFSKAVVCERSDCSVGTTSWLPEGSDLMRVERGFFDEVEPMLGM